MPMYYRRPGVYLEESLLVNTADVAGTFTVGAFIGAAGKGPINEPILVESWSAYVTLFGGFSLITPPPDLGDPAVVTSRLSPPVPANFTALEGHATYGNTKYAVAPYNGIEFTGGQYVVLGDQSKAHFTPHTAAGVWKVGPMTGTPVPPVAKPKKLSYLPYAVYSFFQNGGRMCWVVRATPITAPDKGTSASILVNGTTQGQGTLTSFKLSARSPGLWGNALKYGLAAQNEAGTAFALQVLMTNSENREEVLETFPSLSITGEIPGTRRVDVALNNSMYVQASEINPAQLTPAITTSTPLAGGVDPALPDVTALEAAAKQISKVEGPVAVNIVGYINDVSKLNTDQVVQNWVTSTVPSSHFEDRQDIFVINDSAPPRMPNETSSSYKTSITGPLGANPGDSYCASYGPWITVPDPNSTGSTITIPPAGAVMGMMARVDATVGVFRAPAGVIAGLNNAVGVQAKFTDTELGDLNAQNINIIRSVVGSGICVMGGRTRKSYNADRYVSARRTLIFIKEVVRRSTQFAVFENNDQRLWSSLRMSAERILRPLWQAGGLAGANTSEAYYITCDDTINTPAVIQSGEVRMELGVALEYPAEFVVIRITQFDRGTYTTEVQPLS